MFIYFITTEIQFVATYKDISCWHMEACLQSCCGENPEYRENPPVSYGDHKPSHVLNLGREH